MTYPNKSIFCVCSLIFISVAWAGKAKQTGPSPRDLALLETFHSEQDIVYKTVNGESLDMVLFLPETLPEGKMPVMLYTHGGGWGGGDKFKVFRAPFQEALRELLANGVAVASIEYRLTRKGVSTAVDCVTDCKDAARFLVKNADRFQLDPARIGVWGGSAGGHLALMTGMADNALFLGDEALAEFDPQFRCIVSYYPAVSFLKPELSKGSNFEKPQRLVPMIGGLLEEKREVAALISPSEHLTSAVPPTLLLHGDKDTVLPILHSRYFLARAKEVGAEVRLITVKNGGHSFNGKNIEPSMQEINYSAADFILKHL